MRKYVWLTAIGNGITPGLSMAFDSRRAAKEYRQATLKKYPGKPALRIIIEKVPVFSEKELPMIKLNM